MEIDQPIAHLVDESQPTPNNMTNELMKDTQQLPVQVCYKKIEFTHFITISPQYKKRKRDHINMKGSSVNAV